MGADILAESPKEIVMNLPPLLTIARLNHALAHDALDIPTLTDAALARARASEHIFCALTEARARRLAAQWAQAPRAHPLTGIPVSWKDLYDQSGEVTRAASLTTAFDDARAHDAVSVALLESLGAISIGRTNMTEFALSGLGLNPHFGTPANVWSRDVPLAPGGSSSGAAVSVASGIVAYAMGTDTSGSIRIPAALNGLAGFRPTSSRLSRIGVWTLAPTLDSIGPLAHTAEDICTIMRAFAIDANSARDAPLHFVVPQGRLTENVSPDIAADFAGTLARLREANLPITPLEIPELTAPLALFKEYGTLIALEAWHMHRDALAHAGMMDARVVDRLQSHAHYPASHIGYLLTQRAAWQQTLAARLGDALVLLPTTAIDAPPIAELEADNAFFDTQNRKMLRNTMMGSFFDMPAITIPTGIKANGLPGALMIAGASGRDEAVLHAGRQLASLLTGDIPLNERRF